MATTKKADEATPTPVDPAPVASAPEETPVEPTLLMQYVGTANVREIDEEDWRQMGIDQSTLIWDAENQYRVELDRISAPAQAHLRTDDSFRVISSSMYV